MNGPPLRRRVVLGGLAAALAGVARPGTAAAAPGRVRTGAPAYRGEVPRPEAVIGAGFTERLFTASETGRYLDAVAAASDRVVIGTLGESWSGNPVRYAIVGEPRRVSAHGLDETGRQVRRLRDPHLPPRELAAALAGTPAVAWVGAGVHGTEPAGTNSVLWLLHDLADRRDPAAELLLRNLLVVILPIQNPDGFAAGQRNNTYGFDINREWFAATQREMRGKLELLQRLPPALLIDLHEMAGTSYFFPPYADPVHHEIPAGVLGQVREHGAAIAAEFDRIGRDHFSGTEFDLLYPGFADAATQLSTLSAGLTFEKGLDSPLAERIEEHHAAPWTSLSLLAGNRERLLREWHATHVEAYRQGERGELEPNVHTGTPPVPHHPVRHYFLLDEPERRFELRRAIHRLQLAGVAVHRLTRELTVPDFRPHGGSPGPRVLPAGTYWVPMAQVAKHWVQALLGEQSYPSAPAFTDVGAWSLPLLGNLSAGWSGQPLRPRAAPAPRVTDPEGAGGHPPARRIGLLRLLPGSAEIAGPYGWTLHQLDNVWAYPYTVLHPEDIADGALRDIDVLVAPDGPGSPANERLGDAGCAALRSWVTAGGRYVGWRGSVLLAALAGLTTAGFAVPEAEIPGAFLRVRADTANPLAAGTGPLAWQFYFDDLVFYPTDPAHVLLSYPEVGSPDWYVAGFALRPEQLAGTAAAIDEPFDAGDVVLFGGDPNFRGMADGTARLLRNAMCTAPRTR